MNEPKEKEPLYEDTGGQSAPAKPQPRKLPQKPTPQMLPPWRVILHNDDLNDIGQVVDTVYKLTPLNKQDAESRTLEAHNTGSAMLLVTHQERAELYVEQFASCKLTVTAEADT
ncbi:MAG: ATP-dependent Clp protease adaptor ClpS [Planctomycetota bacterium]|jgi:ATP-dependent Clp protease adapter protein ClpS